MTGTYLPSAGHTGGVTIQIQMQSFMWWTAVIETGLALQSQSLWLC